LILVKININLYKKYTIDTITYKEAMMGNTTVTARLDTRTKEKLDLLAKTTSRSKSFLISEAIRAYVKEQAWQIDAIKEGIEQADAGNFASNQEIKTNFANWGVDVESD